MGSFKFEMAPDADPGPDKRPSRRLAWILAGGAVAVMVVALIALIALWPGA